MRNNNLDNSKIAIVIPYFNASNQIISVISKIPEYINVVIIVNDKSVELLPEKEILETLNKNIKCYFLENNINLGVGGATKKGFYSILDKIIKTGSKIAINISEKV